MSSQCILTIESYKRLDISVLKLESNKPPVLTVYEFNEKDIQQISFHGFPYTVSLNFPNNTGVCPFGYFTLSSVGDFCWMVLNWYFYARLDMRIVAARPDPIKLIEYVIDNRIKEE